MVYYIWYIDIIYLYVQVLFPLSLFFFEIYFYAVLNVPIFFFFDKIKEGGNSFEVVVGDEAWH